MEYTNKQAVATAIKYGREYKKKLANTKLLVIYRDRLSNKIEFIEIVFRPSNFQHLTGLILTDDQGIEKDKCSIEFYHKCVNNNLRAEKVRFKPGGTTLLKLAALPSLTDFTKITRIVGDYDHSKNWLEADIIVGGINYCLAISKKTGEEDGTYFPRSGLLEDIRNITKRSSQVLAVFQKKISDKEKYQEIKHVAKGLEIEKVALSKTLHDMIRMP